jgi:hypothetical protein
MPTLKDRIELLRAEIDEFIDAKVAEEKRNCPGVPEGVLRNILLARSGDCLCRGYLNLTKEDVE